MTDFKIRGVALLCATSLFFSFTTATAETKKRKVASDDDANKKLTVIAVDPNVDVSGFDRNRFNTFSVPQEPTSDIQISSVRNKMFLQAGLSAQDLKGFDELAKDVLYLHAKHHELAKFQARYPRIAPAKLAALKVIVLQAEQQAGKR